VPSLDVFNVGNFNTIQAIRSRQNAANANQIQAILAPRVVRSASSSTGKTRSRLELDGRGHRAPPFFLR